MYINMYVYTHTRTHAHTYICQAEELATGQVFFLFFFVYLASMRKRASPSLYLNDFLNIFF